MSLGPDWLEQDEVVAMHDLTLEGRPELAGQVMRGAAQQLRQLGGVVVDQAPGDRMAGQVAQVDRIAVTEPALDLDDPGRQQRLASLNHGCHRSVVQDQPATGRGGEGGSLYLGGHPAASDARSRAPDPDVRQVNRTAYQRNSRTTLPGRRAVIQGIDV